MRTIATRLALAFLICAWPLGAATEARQSEPPQTVMTPYRAYMEAFEAGDLDAMVARSEEAMEAARRARLDRGTIAMLTENHAQALADSGRHEQAGRGFIALTRALGRSASAQTRGSAHFRAAAAFLSADDLRAAERQIDRALSLIDADAQDAQSLRLRLSAVQTGMGVAWTQGEVRRAGERASEGMALIERLGAVPEGVDLADLAFVSAMGRQISDSQRRADGDFVDRVEPAYEQILAHAAVRARDAESEQTRRFGLWVQSGFYRDDDDARAALAERMRESLHRELFTRADFSILETRRTGSADGLRAPPGYPPGAPEAGLEGGALFRFDVNADGVPENIEVLDAIPHPVFGDMGRAAIERWRYEVPEDGGSVKREDVYTSFIYALDPAP